MQSIALPHDCERIAHLHAVLRSLVDEHLVRLAVGSEAAAHRRHDQAMHLARVRLRGDLQVRIRPGADPIPTDDLFERARDLDRREIGVHRDDLCLAHRARLRTQLAPRARLDDVAFGTEEDEPITEVHVGAPRKSHVSGAVGGQEVLFLERRAERARVAHLLR